ncbi:glycosyltransferase family 4 protein [Tateyamaria omphalii]|uniref:glycosyltransferase family 4 protein n=1 Tax=Tateyamaria omphalii TaxID=299262 RepID=UPI001C992B38|nr:glycosyltransferase family 4 protein [Tateyamaria omphalii]MBY5933582.1 glycosyltransferase family 4 protein [Tateyamaria omphalii]
MKFLFVHQNMPGQYRELIQWLAVQGGHEIVFLTQRKNAPEFAGVKTVLYKTHHTAKEDTYGLSRTWENAAGNGFGAVTALQELVSGGFQPDIVIGHVGWGEMTFFREVLPDTPMIGFFEYYYSVHGGPVGFDPESPVSEHAPYIMHGHNVVPQVNINVVDLGHSPTYWQRDRFPKQFHDKIYVCHDGIRTDTLKPNKKAQVNLGRIGRPLTRKDEVVTFMSRNLETTRGYHQFMRAVPHIQKARPNARILVIGGNDVSYGGKNKHPGGLRGQMEAEVGHLIDWDRLHFLGQVPYESYQAIVQISSCHLYLSMPFVLSWSLLESMSMGATVVASDVAPVREAITHGETGLLVDFFDPEAIAAQVADVLSKPRDYAHLGPAARQHVVDTYDFETVCLPEHIRQINALVPADKRISMG